MSSTTLMIALNLVNFLVVTALSDNLKLCQFSPYCKTATDCILGNKGTQSNLYSQCVPDSETYASTSGGCLQNFKEQCTSESKCCDPGAFCDLTMHAYPQCRQPKKEDGTCVVAMGNPSYKPSFRPSKKPSFSPSYKPTIRSTSVPSVPVTKAPSTKPTRVPNFPPTKLPSTKPTCVPSVPNTKVPSAKPTRVPGVPNTKAPSAKPTCVPNTKAPSNKPTRVPSVPNTKAPSAKPTRLPTAACPIVPCTKTSGTRKWVISASGGNDCDTVCSAFTNNAGAGSTCSPGAAGSGFEW